MTQAPRPEPDRRRPGPSTRAIGLWAAVAVILAAVVFIVALRAVGPDRTAQSPGVPTTVGPSGPGQAPAAPERRTDPDSTGSLRGTDRAP